MLASGRRLDAARMLERSRRRAIRVAMLAARGSVAYRALLQAHGVDPASLGPQTRLETLPVLTQAGTFGRFTLVELAAAVSARDLADVLTSSGRGGPGFGFRLTRRRQHENSWRDIDLGLQDTFSVDQHPTLLVNCLPMGVVFRSRAVAVANVSVREDMACSILRDVGPRFAQTLLCTDPLFIRRILDRATGDGVDWPALNTSVILGEEMLVEAQREYIAARMGIDLDRPLGRLVLSSFGIAELGLNLLFETRETVRIGRALRRRQATEAEAPPTLFCFNPLRVHVEVIDADAAGFGELCFTLLDPQAVIALPRYTSGDIGRLPPRHEIEQAARQAGSAAPWLPVVALRGRRNDRPPGLPSVEQVKQALYRDHAVADHLSGAFRLRQESGGRARLTLQAASEAAADDPTLQRRLHALLAVACPAVPLALELLAPLAFPWRPLLDHERKFTYVESAGR